MKKRILDDNERPSLNTIVKCTEMGNIIELMSSKHTNKNITIKKISKDNYIDLKTGEVKDFEHMKTRKDDLNYVRVSLGKLRDLINTNVVDNEKCKFITLTYAENMTDLKRLYTDVKKFFMRMKYQGYDFEYILAVEPQARGAWHCHVIMIFNEKAPFIPKEKLSKIWSHGFVDVKKIDSVDNVGAYLTAYLGNMEVIEAEQNGISYSDSDVNEVEISENGKKVKKKFIKGARLHMYPAKCNIYRCSNGVKRPIVSYIPEKEAEKKVSSAELTFEQTIEIYDEIKDFKNRFYYRYFNTKRLK